MLLLCYQATKKGNQAMKFGGYDAFAGTGLRPALRTSEEILVSAKIAEQTRSSGNKVHGHLDSLKGVTGESPLLHHVGFDMVDQTVIDMMHIVPGVLGRHLFGMIGGDRLSKQLANAKSRVAIQSQKNDDKAERVLAEKNKDYEKKLAAWKKKTAKANKMKKGSKGRLDKDAEPPAMPVYEPVCQETDIMSLSNIMLVC